MQSFSEEHINWDIVNKGIMIETLSMIGFDDRMFLAKMIQNKYSIQLACVEDADTGLTVVFADNSGQIEVIEEALAHFGRTISSLHLRNVLSLWFSGGEPDTLIM